MTSKIAAMTPVKMPSPTPTGSIAPWTSPSPATASPSESRQRAPTTRVMTRKRRPAGGAIAGDLAGVGEVLLEQVEGLAKGAARLAAAAAAADLPRGGLGRRRGVGVEGVGSGAHRWCIGEDLPTGRHWIPRSGERSQQTGRGCSRRAGTAVARGRGRTMAASSYQARTNQARSLAIAVGTAVVSISALGCGSTRIPTSGDGAPPPLPEAIGAFGSTRLGGAVYAFGGHLGPPHGFSRASESGALLRLELTPGSAWEDLGVVSPALESAGLASHGGLVYRVGGLRVDNAPGQPEDLHSVKTVQVYDPASARWSDVTQMPEGRSAHGTVVIGDRLYAVAGWELDGDLFSGRFATGGFVLDLSRTGAAWQPIPPPPFKLRSLSVTAVGDDIYAIGGATDVPGEFSNEVYVLDTRSGTWSRGRTCPLGPRSRASAQLPAPSAAACTSMTPTVSTGSPPAATAGSPSRP